MKQAYVIVGILLLSTSVFAKQVKVKVKGFVCSLCGQGVEKQLKKKSNDAVSNFSVDMDTKIVTLDIKEGQSLDDDLIKKAVKDAGYAVESIEHIAPNTSTLPKTLGASGASKQKNTSKGESK